MDIEEPRLRSIASLPDDAIQSILAAVVRTTTPVNAIQSLCAIRATSSRLGQEVHAADQLWASLAAACFPEERLSQEVDSTFTRSHLCAIVKRWLAYAAAIEPPTLAQMVQVVHRSSNAHSYYKHLNIGRNTPFSFRLDCTAGMRRVSASQRISDETYTNYVRGDGTEFHYTWTPTVEYRTKFGFLAYDDGRPMSLPEDYYSPSHQELIQPTGRSLQFYDVNGVGARMPAYIVDDSTCLCSAAVHGSGSHHGYYEIAVQILVDKGREALEGVVREGAVCAAALQRRHSGSRIVLPPEALDTLEALLEWRPRLLAVVPPALHHDEGASVGRMARWLRGLLLGRRPPSSVEEEKQAAHDADATGDDAQWADFLEQARAVGAEIFPKLKGRALLAATASMLPSLLTGLRDTGEKGNRALALVAEITQRVAERYAMLERVARLVQHVCREHVDMGRVHAEDALFKLLIGDDEV